MIILGLTGSMATGKSTVSKLLKTLWHIPVWDADEEVRKLLITASIQAQLEEIFPQAFVDGQLQRGLLRAHVFENPHGLALLEAVLYPILMTGIENFMRACQRRNCPLIVLDVPLLFEKGWSVMCDYTMVVTCKAPLQRQRVLKRPGMTEKQMNHVLNNQFPQHEKVKLADFWVRSDLSKGFMVTQLKSALKTLNFLG